MEFKSFPKMARLNRDIVITEKLDGTNAQIAIADDGVTMKVGSRNRWITPEDDNYGFARWCYENEQELLKLGPGRHFGEWWGKGIQRGYNMHEKRFSLFNTTRWWPVRDELPKCVSLVPILYRGPNTDWAINGTQAELRHYGSRASQGFMNPEGIIVFHTAANITYKVTLDNDGKPKSLVSPA